MFTRIEALGYRCLRYVTQPLGAFNVLVGPNASGKTTFLDVITFLGDLVSKGLDEAMAIRASTPEDLTWARGGDSFELAVEARIPEALRQKHGHGDQDAFRYEVAIGFDQEAGVPCIQKETGILTNSRCETPAQQSLFPDCLTPPETICLPSHQSGKSTVFSKRPRQDDNYYPESSREEGKRGGWMPAFKLGPRRSTLANLPEDETRFPVATWFKQLLDSGVQQIVLNSRNMRNPCPRGSGSAFRPDGANLPWVIQSLQDESPKRFRDWLAHVQTALPDIAGVRTVEREEDRHRYLVVHHRQGIDVPSWLLSDGTLRLLALTLLAYLPEFSGVYLIEEPENGIHPRAIETMFQSLSSVYSAQLLLATHSPVILSAADVKNILCFAKTAAGETSIVRGDQHPALAHWQRDENLGVLFAAGVLGQ